MMDVKTNNVPANCQILNNSPALHSLKRQQLIQLCKRNGIKASGKNTEIVEKLKAYAVQMNIDPSILSSQPCSSDDDDKENRRVPMPRPSEQWTIVEEDSREIELVKEGLKEIREEVEQELGKTSPFKGFGTSQSSGEFGGGSKSSKGSSMSSSLRAFATSLRRNNSKSSGNALIKSSTPPSSSFPLRTANSPVNDSLRLASVPYNDHPIRYPHLPDPEPLNADDSRDQSMLELGASTIRLVPPAPTVQSPPKLQPIIPTFEPSFSPGSPVPSIYPSLPVDQDSVPSPPGAFPTMNHASSPLPRSPASCAPPFLFGSPDHRISNTQFNSAAGSVLAEMNARLGLSGTTGEVSLDSLQKSRMETQPAALPLQGVLRSEVTSKFDRAHEREFARMEGLGTWYAKRNAGSSNKPDVAPSKKRKSEALGEMRKKQVEPSVAHRRRISRVVTPGTRRSLVSCSGAEEGEERKAKRVRISTVKGVEDKDEENMDVDEETQKAKEEREKERAAIKKKLEVSRARRRSSMGRVSVGAGRPALIPNQPKKGTATKFGFLASAKTIVKNVWNKGVGASAPQRSKPHDSKVSKPSLPSNRPGPTSNVLKKAPAVPKNDGKNSGVPAGKADSNGDTGSRIPSMGLGRKLSTRMTAESSVGTKSTNGSSVTSRNNTPSTFGAQLARRRPIPSFQSPIRRVSRANSLISSQSMGSRTSGTGTTSTRGGSIMKPGTIGARKSGLSTNGSTSSAVRNRTTSTLFAPTASSLAKMQSTVRPPSLSIVNSDLKEPKTKLPPRLSPRDGSAADKSNVVTTIFTSAPILTPGLNPSSDVPASKPRPLPARRPRISRSRVIARLGEQRAASGSSQASTTSARRSLNVSRPRGSLSARASGIGVKTRGRESAVAMSARKRLRQSEVLRRKSKISGLSPPRPEMESTPEGGENGNDSGSSFEKESGAMEVSEEC